MIWLITRGKAMLANLLYGAALGYAGLVGGLYLLQDRLLFHPVRGLTATPAEAGLPFEEVWIETSDRLLIHGWWLPKERPRKTLLLLHGNAGNLSHRLPLLERLYRRELAILAIDYRGYGRSSGRPSERGTYLDAEAAWRHLVEVRGVPPEEIVLYGRSLGGSIAAYLASRRPVAGAILEGTFTSIPDLASERYPYLPVRLLARHRYPTLEYVREISAPLLLLHGREDLLIPFRHAERLFEEADHPKELAILPGGHNDLPFATDRFWHLFDRWLASL